MYLVSLSKPHFDWSCTSSRLTYVPFSSLLSGCCLFNLQWIRLWSWNFSTLLRGKVTLRKSIATRSDAASSSIVIWRRVPSSWRPRELTRKIRFILTEDWPLVESLPPTPMDYRPLSHRGVLRSSASSFNLVCIFRFSGASAFPVPSPLLISLRAGKKHCIDDRVDHLERGKHLLEANRCGLSCVLSLDVEKKRSDVTVPLCLLFLCLLF